MSPQALAIASSLPACLLVAGGLLTAPIASRHPRAVASAVSWLAALSLAAAAAGAAMLPIVGPVDKAMWAAPGPLPLNMGVFVDSLTAVMLLLVSFVGLVIARFAARALDGEPRQGRFFVWLSLTLGAVLLLVVSRNLVMFTGAWMLTSYGLHHLLEHYPDRPWAVWAARKKFLISRLGDAFLLAAVGLTLWRFGSSDYATIFARADELRRSGGPLDPWLPTIGIFFVLGAMTKSAQFPFHSWLPDTMEAPTPVSALMHAGIINAGGFLVIRLSPLVSLSHVALDLLALVGAFTALFGGAVMLTQTSIKRALAFSTIAQMGFMMLQCGLGAFTAALLHIVAHSLYKAHAFLTSGSVLDAAATMKVEASPAAGLARPLTALPVAAGVAGAATLGSLAAFGIDPAVKPGGFVLAAVMGIALTTLVWQALLSGCRWVSLTGVGAAFGVGMAYAAAYVAVDRLMASAAIAHNAGPTSSLDAAVAALVVVGFLSMFAIQAAGVTLARLPVVRSLYVHAANGLYCDIPARRITARVWGLKAPVP
ncbi:MAG: NADH-quinone oxidoreductase subunit L [Planctomycetaceae bacterium]